MSRIAAGGLAVLFDYSGVIFLSGLFAYTLFVHRESHRSQLIRSASWYAAGAVVPGALLMLYQWQSFGHPLYPGQHWMTPVRWSELGYQGYGFPQLELFQALGFDYRFGLFVTCPLLIAALVAPFITRGTARVMPVRELTFILLTVLALWVFFSGSNYTRLQYNTGVRYMAPAIPFLFIPTAVVLMRLPTGWRLGLAGLAFVQSWALAMYRDVSGGQERFADMAAGWGVLDPVWLFLTEGVSLPVPRTLSRLELATLFGEQSTWAEPLFNPTMWLAVVGLMIAIIWIPRRRRALGGEPINLRPD